MRRGAPVSRRPRLYRAFGTALVAGCACLLSATGCTGSEEPKPPDLSARVQEYMTLRQKGSWDAIWNGMIDPQVRSGLKRGSFMARRESAFDILDFEIVSVDEEGDQGRVVARMDAIVPVLKPGGGILRIPRELDDSQDWVLREGRWYIQLRG